MATDEPGKMGLPLTRRALTLAALAGGATALTSRAASAAVASSAASFSEDPKDLLRAYVKMRCSLGPELCMGWLRGQRFSYSEGRVEPFCGMLAATYSTLNQVSDDEYEFLVLEVTFYTDSETGELLETVEVPFTGERVAVPVHRFGPQAVRFSVDLDEVEHFEPEPGTNQSAFASAGSVAMTKSIDKAYVDSGDLFLRHEEYGRRYPAGSDRPSMFYRESTVWNAPLAKVQDPTIQQVDSEVSYAAMTSWRPWMNMGSVPGHTFSNGYGRRAHTFDDLPEDYLDMVRKVHPDVLDDPLALLKSGK